MKLLFTILLCFFFLNGFSQTKNDSNMVKNGKDVLVSFGKIKDKGTLTKEEILKTDSLTVLAPNGGPSGYKVIAFIMGVEESSMEAEEFSDGNRLSDRQKKLVVQTRNKTEIFIESITLKKGTLVKKLDCTLTITVKEP